jgi:hypothetical protein
MTSAKPTDIKSYLESLPEEKRKLMDQFRKVIRKHLPKGFEEVFNYGMIGYVVPHKLYPAGYHCNPSQPLPFISLSANKSGYSFHHMGLYADTDLLRWFEESYAREASGKLDMGKGCVRFKKPEFIPFDLLGKLVAKMSVKEWVALYERKFKGLRVSR